MSSWKIINSIIFVSFLSACTAFEPYIDRRREAGGLANGALYIGKSAPEKPAVCYNKFYSSFEEVKAVADASCVENNTGTHAEPLEERVFSCTFATPAVYYFECKK